MRTDKNLRTNKKGVSALTVGGVVALLFAIVVLSAFVPIHKEQIEEADEINFTCIDVPSTPVYNATNGLCCLSVINCSSNASAREVGLTTTEETLLGLVSLLIIIGIIVSVVAYVGLKRK